MTAQRHSGTKVVDYRTNATSISDQFHSILDPNKLCRFI